jgi:hypothetical protein
MMNGLPVVVPLGLEELLVRPENLWVAFDGSMVQRVRHGQVTCPQDKPVDSRFAVRDLPTAPRFETYGLTR